MFKGTKVDSLSGGYTLLEVLAMSVLLATFLTGFYLGSMRLSSAMLVQQDRNEALLQSRRVGELWRSGGNISGLSSGNFLNGVPYTVTYALTQYSGHASNSTLNRLAVTIGWNEPDPNSTNPRAQHLKDIYATY